MSNKYLILIVAVVIVSVLVTLDLNAVLVGGTTLGMWLGQR